MNGTCSQAWACKEVQVWHRIVFPVAFGVAVPAIDERLSVFLARRQRIIRRSAGKKRVPHLADSFTDQIREEMNTYGELHILRKVWLDPRHRFGQSLQESWCDHQKSRWKQKLFFSPFGQNVSMIYSRDSMRIFWKGPWKFCLLLWF